jgi:hypothetical protein
MERVTRRGKVMVAGVMNDGRFMGRVCVLSFRTRRAELEVAVQHIAEETAALLAEAARGATPGADG